MTRDQAPNRKTKKPPPPGRDAAGRFVPGKTGNPHGRPAVVVEVRELARHHGPAAIERLRQLMYSEEPSVCVAAARELLNRGFGRVETSISLPNGGALVNIQMGAPIATPEAAAEAYRMIIGNSRFDFDSIRFASPSDRVPGHQSHSERGHLLEAAPREGSEPVAAPAPREPGSTKAN